MKLVQTLLFLFIANIISYSQNNDNYPFMLEKKVIRNLAPSNNWIIEKGDFNGDSYDDIFLYHPSNGTLWVMLYDPAINNYKTPTIWKTVVTLTGWNFKVGDYNGDNKDDILAYHINGTIWVGISNNNEFLFNNWATINNYQSTFSIFVEDFDGDKSSDVLYYNNFDGSLTVLLSNKVNGFNKIGSGVWKSNISPASNWKFYIADFNADNKVDVLGYFPGNGTLWVGENKSTYFDFGNTYWADLVTDSGWVFVLGNFNADNKIDVMGYHESNGTFWVGENFNSNFNFGVSNWATTITKNGWEFKSIDFTKDGYDDVIGFNKLNNSFWLFTNNINLKIDDSNKFITNQIGSSSSGLTKFIANIDYNKNGLTDFLTYREDSGSLEILENKMNYLGYVWPLSASSFDTIKFFTSGIGNDSVKIYKHFSINQNVEDSLVLTLKINNQVYYPYINSYSSKGCNWPESFFIIIPDNWPTGFYSAELTDKKGFKFNITFIVKGKLKEKVAVLANINTWLAYNCRYSACKYSVPDLNTVLADFSFHQPLYTANPKALLPSHTLRAELWLPSFLKKNGYNFNLITDLDLHQRKLDTNFKALFLTTHPEYWSDSMYDNLNTFIKRGGSLFYLGGNGIYERVSYKLGKKNNVCNFLNNRININREDATFRIYSSTNNGVPTRPELSILGVSTIGCGITGNGYLVKSNNHFLFNGTSVNNGDTLGNYGYNLGNAEFDFNFYSNGKASGWEVDNDICYSNLNVSNSFLCGVTKTVNCNSITKPPNIQILAEALHIKYNSFTNKYDTVTNPIVFFKPTDSNFVFSAGSINFVGSMIQDSMLTSLILNALKSKNLKSSAIPNYQQSYLVNNDENFLYYYRNQTNSQLIYVSSIEIKRIELYDILGRKFYELIPKNTEVQIPHFENTFLSIVYLQGDIRKILKHRIY